MPYNDPPYPPADPLPRALFAGPATDSFLIKWSYFWSG